MQAIIQNNEKGIPKINGSTLLPTLYMGNINKAKIKILNRKKYKFILSFLFIPNPSFFLSYLLVKFLSSNHQDLQ